MRLRPNLFLFSLICVLKATAQTISPQPQEATYGVKAFTNDVCFMLVGADKADRDAVETVKSAFGNAKSDQTVRLIMGEANDKAVRAYRHKIPQHAEGYYLSITPTEVIVAGRDEVGTYYGVQTLLQLMQEPEVRQCEINDWPSVACRGVIEGFYGNPWSHRDRLRQFNFYGKHKLNIYVYGPKDDPYHRARWREPYPEKEAEKLKELVSAAHRQKVQFVWAIHPGGDIRWTLEDSLAVVRKLEAMYQLGIRSFAVFFDDIWGEGAKGDRQAGLLNYVTDEFVHRHQPLIMCPTQYNKSWSTGSYLPTLGENMYPEVRIMWTGNTVVDMIERDDLEWVNGWIKRKAFIWLNYPVNDYCQSRLLMGKTYGNGLDISELVSGFCSNPMEYAEASKVSLWSIADYTWNMPRYDADASWRRAKQELMPTSADAFGFFCQQNIDLGKTGHGLRREGESADFVAITQSEHQVDYAKSFYFSLMQSYAGELLADSINQPEMLNEIAPWVESMRLLGQRGWLTMQMKADLQRSDTLAFIGHYKMCQEAERKQKAIVSRDFEGSIVKARPVVSGDVVTPWVEEQVHALVKEYRSKHAYGQDVFPVQSIVDGEYYIKVSGMFLTNSQAGVDRVGDYPVFVAERDTINPQRQQWVIELEPKTGRYKITNKQDGRYVNEQGCFWRDKIQNPYDADWHTYVLSHKDGHYSIQCAGKAGAQFWGRRENVLVTNDTEQLVFDLVPVK